MSGDMTGLFSSADWLGAVVTHFDKAAVQSSERTLHGPPNSSMRIEAKAEAVAMRS